MADVSDNKAKEAEALYEEGCAFEGAAVVALVHNDSDAKEADVAADMEPTAMEIMMEDGVLMTVELDSGEKRLAELGYKQDLRRALNAFEQFSVSFSGIGLFTAIIPYFGLAFQNGGPVAVVWFWWITCFFAFCLALSLAEISSSFPVAGSLYFWAASLAPKKMRPFASWITGWMELLGAAASAGGVSLAGVQLLSDIVVLATGGLEGGYGLSSPAQFGLSVALLVVACLINLLPIKYVGRVLIGSTIFQIVAGVATAIVIPAVAPTTQSASWVFGTFNSNIGFTQLPSSAYAVVIGFLMSQYALYAFDTSTHTSEEAKRSDITTPISMLASCATVAVLGWAILVAFTFSIQDTTALYENTLPITQQVMMIMLDVFQGRFGSNAGVYVFICFFFSTFFFCVVTASLAASRTAYALSRDHGLPFSFLWRHVNSWGVPIYAIILSVSISIVFNTPLLAGNSAYYAVTGTATTAWFTAYAVPIGFRLTAPQSSFVPGPFYLAEYVGPIGSKIIHALALLYVVYTAIVFNLPAVFPITKDNFNYNPIGVGVFIVIFVGWWVLDARKWFRGPDPIHLVDKTSGGEVDSSYVPKGVGKIFQ